MARKYYDKFYDQGKPGTIVLLHGWMCSSLNYESNLDSLKNFYNVLVFDYLGHGKSERPKDYIFSLDNYLSQLEDILSKYHLKESLILVGHSLGGVLAYEYLQKNPSKVAKIVLIDPPMGKQGLLLKPLKFLLKIFKNFIFFQRFITRLYRREFIQNIWTNWLIGPKKEYPRACEITVMGMEITQPTAIIDGLIDTLSDKYLVDFEGDLSKVRVIIGERDPLVNQQVLLDKFDKNSLKIVGNSRHTPNRTNIAEFNSQLLQLLK